MIFFTTKHLIFRRFELNDVHALAKITADKEVSRYVDDGSPQTLPQTQEWIENSRENIKLFGYGTGAVLSRESKSLIGWAGIARPYDGTEELIYGLDRSYWGIGLGMELLTGSISWARDSLKMTELRASVYTDNKASIAILTRQGFKRIDVDCKAEENIDLYRLCLDSRIS